jgi:enamine deaminase RidA (YjgF/YER057c/UK114 family)
LSAHPTWSTTRKAFPAMAVIEVTRLVEPEALVDIEATVVVPEA